MCFSADGRRPATGAGYVEELLPAEIKLLDVAARTTLKTFHGHKATVSGLAFAPDGKTLLSVSLDRSARVWQVPNE